MFEKQAHYTKLSIFTIVLTFFSFSFALSADDPSDYVGGYTFEVTIGTCSYSGIFRIVTNSYYSDGNFNLALYLPENETTYYYGNEDRTVAYYTNYYGYDEIYIHMENAANFYTLTFLNDHTQIYISGTIGKAYLFTPSTDTCSGAIEGIANKISSNENTTTSFIEECIGCDNLWQIDDSEESCFIISTFR